MDQLIACHCQQEKEHHNYCLTRFWIEKLPEIQIKLLLAVNKELKNILLVEVCRYETPTDYYSTSFNLNKKSFVTSETYGLKSYVSSKQFEAINKFLINLTL